MAYIITPGFGMKLADPATVQQFETSVVNADFLALENGIIAETGRATAAEAAVAARATTLEGYGRIFTPASPAALNALNPTPGVTIGDMAQVSTPGTGITRHFWILVAGGFVMTPLGTITAATMPNMNSYIAVIAALAKLQFTIGSFWYNTDDGQLYMFTSAAGAYRVVPNKFIMTRTPTAVATNASLTALALTALTLNSGAFSHAAGVLTCVRAGTYKVTAIINWAASATGARAAQLLHSDATSRAHQDATIPAAIDHTIVLSWVKAFTVGQTLTLLSQQNSGGNLAVSADIEMEQVL